MRLLIQRVSHASVEVEGTSVGSIGPGYLVFTGFKKGDTESLLEPMAKKLLSLRAFSDHEGKMNLAVDAVGGELLLVSQFTLYADTKRGNRPGFDPCLDATSASKLFNQWVALVRGKYPKTQSGVFQAHMKVSLLNDGPVTLLLELENE